MQAESHVRLRPSEREKKSVGRPSKYPTHPLSKLRKMLGLSRHEFGELVDVSFETIKSIESGRMKMSAGLANRIHFITGALPRELVKGPDGKLLGTNGKPYSAAEFRRRREEQANPPHDYVELLSSKVASELRSKLNEAAETGRFAAVYFKALDAIERL